MAKLLQMSTDPRTLDRGHAVVTVEGEEIGSLRYALGNPGAELLHLSPNIQEKASAYHQLMSMNVCTGFPARYMAMATANQLE